MLNTVALYIYDMMYLIHSATSIHDSFWIFKQHAVPR
jgi:hypothetical protein